MGNLVAVVGRPNVGKSTFFNRLVGGRVAIVDEFSGVTRDRHYGRTEWNGVEFGVIDTGGYVQGSDDIFEAEIRKQVEIAIDESNVIIFLVDVTSGITDLDDRVARLLRKSKKPVFVAVNKVDDPVHIIDTYVFHQFGIGEELFNISSMTGSGTGDLLDAVVKSFDNKAETEDTTGLPRFAVVGKPNVGKSSFINSLLGTDRNIVTDIAGTTRDSIDTHYKGYGFDFLLVDTAGVRKKSKVSEDLEFYSVMRTIRAIEDCDVVILLIDAAEGIGAQDINIFHLAERNNKGVVIMVNKWDLIEKDHKTADLFEEVIREKIAPFKDVPIIFTSVLTKQRIFKTLETAVAVYENKNKRIKTSELNEFLLPLIERNPPPATKGKYIKIKYITQLPVPNVPTFAFFCNLPQYVAESYKRFLENRMREEFDFTGVPISLFFRQK